MPHPIKTAHARALVANPATCADQPALRAWAWHVLRGRPLEDETDTPLALVLSMGEAARLSRIRAQADRIKGGQA